MGRPDLYHGPCTVERSLKSSHIGLLLVPLTAQRGDGAFAVLHVCGTLLLDITPDPPFLPSHPG